VVACTDGVMVADMSGKRRCELEGSSMKGLLEYMEAADGDHVYT